MELVFGGDRLETLLAAARGDNEIGAVAYLDHEAVGDRYLVVEVEVAVDADRLSATPVAFTFAPQFLTRVTRKARERRLHLALIHSHLSGFPCFSSIDDATEDGLRTFLQERLQGQLAFSVLICRQELTARQVGEKVTVPVVTVGAVVRRHESGSTTPTPHIEQFDRQVRLFGIEGQAILKRLSVAVVGLGGTGSVLVQQLAYLGIERFSLIDPDVLEESNRNRVVGASANRIGQSKVQIATEVIRCVQPDATIDPLQGNVVSREGLDLLRAANCIFICTDSHVSRAFISEFANQYLVPAFDVGVSINAPNGRVESITGRTQMVAPGLACLLCAGVLDARRIREELMTPEQRSADPYFNDHEGVHQPAVISLNSAMVSMTVTMFLAAFLGIPGRARWQSFDGIAGTVRVLSSKPDPDCPVCGRGGVAAQANRRALSFLGDTP